MCKGTGVHDLQETSPKHAKHAIRTYGGRVKQRELRQAFGRLEANDSLTDAQRATVSQMVVSIVDGILGQTLDILDDNAVCDDTIQTIVELYDSHECNRSP